LLPEFEFVVSTDGFLFSSCSPRLRNTSCLNTKECLRTDSRL